MAGSVEGGVAGGGGGLLPFFGVVRVCCVVLFCLGSSEACDPFVGASVGFARQCLGPLEGGYPDVLALCLSAGPPGDKVHDGLVHALPWDRDVPEGVNSEGGQVLLQTESA